MRFILLSLCMIIAFFVRLYSLQTINTAHTQLYDQLLTAVGTNDQKAIEEVINLYKKSDIHLDSYRNSAQTTPLMQAAYLGNKNAVETLLFHGARAMAQDIVDKTALDYAKKGLHELAQDNVAKTMEFNDIIALLQTYRIK